MSNLNETLLVRRYKNRKLYNTEISQYITVGDLVLSVTAGRPVKVTDHSTGEDITNAVLARAVEEVVSNVNTEVVTKALVAALVNLKTLAVKIETL